MNTPSWPAFVAQFVPAATSVALHAIAAHRTGATGLALFATLYGGCAMVGALAIGLVADPLTLLDRHRVRAGLACWAALTIGGSTFVAVLVTAPIVGIGSGSVVGVAAAGVAAAEMARRALAVTHHQVALAGADTAGAVVACAIALVGPPTVTTSMVATSVGRLVVVAVAAGAAPRLVGAVVRGCLAPAPDELSRRHGMVEVWRTGRWRLAQHALRPAMWTAMRATAVSVVGAAAWGRVETSRLIVAPALLVSNAVGLSLLTSATTSRTTRFDQRLREARRAARRTAALQVSCIVVVLCGLAGIRTIDTGTTPDLAAVAGWSVLAIVTGITTPIGMLLATHGAHARTAGARLLEVGATAISVVVALSAGAPPATVPWAAAAWMAVAAVPLLRWVAQRTEPPAVAGQPR